MMRFSANTAGVAPETTLETRGARATERSNALAYTVVSDKPTVSGSYDLLLTSPSCVGRVDLYRSFRR
jgi:hypothetical protein